MENENETKIEVLGDNSKPKKRAEGSDLDMVML